MRNRLLPGSLTIADELAPTAILRLRTQKPMYVQSGLQIGGKIQTFFTERRMQERAAQAVVRTARRVVNIGFGLGYAHAVFRKANLEKLILVEINDHLATTAARGAVSGELILRGPWQVVLAEQLTESCSAYFDAFPLDNNFDYSARAFKRYLGAFLSRLPYYTNISSAYLVAFQRGLAGIGLDEYGAVPILRIPLPSRIVAEGVSHFVLYEWRRATV